jgi:hypothetical protein
MSDITKKRYIKNNISILSLESKIDIYKIIKEDNPNAIRDSKNIDGLYVNLDKILNRHNLDSIYNIVKERKECIKKK